MTRIFLHPDERAPLSQLARELRLDAATVQREAQRLEEAGIVSSEWVGRARLLRPNEASPFYPELAGLIAKAFGPVPVLREKLGRLHGVEAAYVYGSWARRYLGERGEQPGDIDLLVVGKPERLALARLSREASKQLGFDVHPTVVRAKDWASGATGFIRSVRSEPLVPLIEDENDRG